MTRSPRSFAHIAPKGRPRPTYDGIKFRSKAECTVARALHVMGWEWEYEPTEFVFEEIRRGTRFYTPDFQAWPQAQPDKFRWIEVKGYIDKTSLTKLRRFARYYPENASRLVLVTDADVTSLLDEPCFRKLLCPDMTDRMTIVPEVWSLRRLERLGGMRA